MTAELDRLEAIAKAANQWSFKSDGPGYVEVFEAFRSTFDPPTVLALIATQRALVEALDGCLPYVARYEAETMSNVALEVYSKGEAALLQVKGVPHV